MHVGFYEDRINHHPARVALVEAQELATKAAGVSFEGLDLDVPEHADAARAAVEDVVTRIDLADPRLISEGMLSDLNRPALRIRDFLNEFLSNPGSASIQDVQAELERLLTAARGLPPLPWQTESAVVRNAARRFRDRLAGLRREAEQRIDELREEGDAAAADLRSHLSEVGSQFQQLQQQAKAAEDAAERRSDELNHRLDEQHERAEQVASTVEQTLNSIEERFGSTQQSREERFGEAVREQEQRFAASLVVRDGEWEEKKAKLGDDSDAIRRALEEQLAEAKRVLGVTAAASTYQAAAREAESQSRAANVWRIVAVLAMGGAALSIFLFFAAFGLPQDPTTAEMLGFLVTRGGFTGFIGAIAAYAAREAGQHRARERTARQAAVDIASFRPFLAELPDHERNAEIRSAARRHFFGSENDAHGSSSSSLEELRSPRAD